MRNDMVGRIQAPAGANKVHKVVANYRTAGTLIAAAISNNPKSKFSIDHIPRRVNL